MPPHLHLDYESFSLADITEVGGYRYAFDPSTEILCAAMALEDGEPVAWDCSYAESDEVPRELDPYWDALEDPEVLIYAHNAQFEYAMSQALMWKTWGIAPPALSRFRCTMSLARRAALPAKLEKLSEFLGDQVKDAAGKRLIKKFSMMQPAKKPTKKNPAGVPVRRILPTDDPEDFARFVEYCRQDVRAEQSVAQCLAYFGDALNNANYTLHEVINARGVPVNIPALRHAQKLIDEETEIVGAKFKTLTGFEVTQGAKVLAWAQANDYPYGDLQVATVEQYLEEEEQKIGEPGIAEQALRLRASVSYAAIKKVKTMLACVGPGDNRIRGMFAHHLATTGRSGGMLVQMQNLKRPTINNSEAAYRDICAGVSREMLEIVYGPPLEVISSCIRHFIHDVFSPMSGSLNDCDYSSIESRIACWLASQEDALQEYREGVDRYKRMAAFVYGIAEEAVNKFPQRFVGKGLILGASYGLGAPKFRVTCKKPPSNYELPEGLEFKAIKAWRKKHNKIVKLWPTLDDAAKSAVLHKGEVFPVGEYLSFKVITAGGIEFLLMRLPSGRKLAYPWPKIVPGKFEGTTAVSFYQNLKGVLWGHNSGIWGGVFFENACQAVAADIMCHGAQNAEDAGYEIAALIHDQALAYHQPHQSPEEFVRLLTDLPEWAKGLPLAAEGALVPFYKKD